MYLIIGYKPSRDDYCRGCLMSSYDSSSVIERVKTPIEAAKFIANNDVFNSAGANWNWTVITSEMISNEEHYFSSDLEYDDIPPEICQLLDEERSKALHILKSKESKAKEDEKKKSDLIQRAKDEAEFERLKQLLEKD